ncbi:hypothetical protein JQC72_13960 [Polycladomyces sp. WAk]|uniref:FeS cluster biogenesis domain-containing protein n=1 Tax=Polycladomyces zharkentensis TaxID=2807616 RepID=A0ABS2WMU9_9BACL|nr:hypothetical protein [Polycladomyces sp. WAk]MBN2910605.1 hypothetical protein [Polycladomyces sp. WAk]
MDIQISPAAVARLKAILSQEEDGERLAVRVVPLTSGCGSPSFAIELTEARPGYLTVEKEGILFAFLRMKRNGWTAFTLISTGKTANSRSRIPSRRADGVAVSGRFGE